MPPERASTDQASPTASIWPATSQGMLRTTISLGAVRGRVEVLSQSEGMRFSLRELASDESVECHPDPGFEDRLSNASGQIADVTGTITRDAATGRAISVSEITRIETVEEGDPMGYLLARGTLRLREPAEEAVRRVRGATR